MIRLFIIVLFIVVKIYFSVIRRLNAIIFVTYSDNYLRYAQSEL